MCKNIIDFRYIAVIYVAHTTTIKMTKLRSDLHSQTTPILRLSYMVLLSCVLQGKWQRNIEHSLYHNTKVRFWFPWYDIRPLYWWYASTIDIYLYFRRVTTFATETKYPHKSESANIECKHMSQKYYRSMSVSGSVIYDTFVSVQNSCRPASCPGGDICLTLTVRGPS